MNILVISQKNNISITGGQIINKRICDLITQVGHNLVYSYNLHKVKGNMSFLFSLLFHIKEYLKYDKILIDSSSFPKTVWFVLLTNMFGMRNKMVVTLHHFIYEGMAGLKGKLYKIQFKWRKK